MGSYAYYQRFEDGKWGADNYWFVVDGVRLYILLVEGDRLEDSLPLYFYLRNAPGRYRIVYRVYRDKDLKKLLPLKDRVSAPFDVVE